MIKAYPVNLGGRDIDLYDLNTYLKSLGFSYYYGVSTTPNSVNLLSSSEATDDDYNLLLLEFQEYLDLWDELDILE